MSIYLEAFFSIGICILIERNVLCTILIHWLLYHFFSQKCDIKAESGKNRTLRGLMVNSLTPMSDQDRISPYNINTTPSEKWLLREMTIKKSLANPIPNSPNPNHKSCMIDSKENYCWDPECRGVRGQNCGSIKGDFSMMRKTHCASNEIVISFGLERLKGQHLIVLTVEGVRENC